MDPIRTPATRPSQPRWVVAAWGSGGFLAVLWASELLDMLLGHRLDEEGIRPHSTEGLSGILLAPLLHGDWAHLMANSVPVLLLSFLVLLSGVGVFVRATAVIWLLAGVGTWLFGGEGTIHLGASSLVFGWLTFLVLRGFFHRDGVQVLIGIGVLLAYGSMLLGVLPGTPGISWQGHLFGAVGGAVAAWWGSGEARRERPQPGYESYGL